MFFHSLLVAHIPDPPYIKVMDDMLQLILPNQPEKCHKGRDTRVCQTGLSS